MRTSPSSQLAKDPSVRAAAAAPATSAERPSAEYVLARARAFLAIAALFGVYVVPIAGNPYQEASEHVAWAYAAVALLLWFALRRHTASPTFQITLHVADLTWAAV